MIAGGKSGKFVFLAGDFLPDVGGIQRYAAELCRAVAGAGWPVVAVAPRRQGAEGTDGWLAEAGVGVVRVGGGGKARLCAAMAWALRRLVRRGDVVVATKWMPEGPAYLLARPPAPMVLIGYGDEFLPRPGRPVKAFAQRAVLRAARACLAISRYTAGNFAGAGVEDGRISVIYAGVDLRRFGEQARQAGQRLRERLGLEGPVLLTVARLIRRKGIDVCLRAFAEVAGRVDGARYVIVGDGPMRDELEQMARRLGLVGKVVFVGEAGDEDVPAWFWACDVFAMTPRRVEGEPVEGFGLVYLEAAACRKPSIGSRSGGVPDAIVDGATGLLVPEGDVEATARAMERLLGDGELGRRMGEAARRRVEAEFTWQAVAKRFIEALGERGLLPARGE